MSSCFPRVVLESFQGRGVFRCCLCLRPLLAWASSFFTSSSARLRNRHAFVAGFVVLCARKPFLVSQYTSAGRRSESLGDFNISVYEIPWAKVTHHFHMFRNSHITVNFVDSLESACPKSNEHVKIHSFAYVNLSITFEHPDRTRQLCSILNMHVSDKKKREILKCLAHTKLEGQLCIWMFPLSSMPLAA